MKMKTLILGLVSLIMAVRCVAGLSEVTETIEDGTRTTFYRNGIKILTDEVIFVGQSSPQRRIQIQVVWLGDVSVLRIDTFMIEPMRFYFYKEGIEMTELTESKEIVLTRRMKNHEDDIREGFLVGEDGMLTPLSDERWQESCVPVTSFEELNDRLNKR